MLRNPILFQTILKCIKKNYLNKNISPDEVRNLLRTIKINTKNNSYSKLWSHTHNTHTRAGARIYMYIYIYIYVCVCVCACVCVCVFGQHFFIEKYLIKQYIHPLSTHVCIYPFESPHRFYDIRRHLVNKPPIINWFPNTFSPMVGHHLVCVYCKSDENFVCTLLLCKTWPFMIYTGISNFYF